jgi:hypothetical protein
MLISISVAFVTFFNIPLQDVSIRESCPYSISIRGIKSAIPLDFICAIPSLVLVIHMPLQHLLYCFLFLYPILIDFFIFNQEIFDFNYIINQFFKHLNTWFSKPLLIISK